MEKLNCWEYKKCGRESGGVNAEELGICPVAVEKKADGMNGGINGGRICWGVARMPYFGKNKSACCNSLISCLECDFFKLVSTEESFTLKTSHDIIPKLMENK